MTVKYKPFEVLIKQMLIAFEEVSHHGGDRLCTWERLVSGLAADVCVTSCSHVMKASTVTVIMSLSYLVHTVSP